MLLGIRVQATERNGVSPFEVLFGVPPSVPLTFKFKDLTTDLPLQPMDADVIQRLVVALSQVRVRQWKELQKRLKESNEKRLIKNHPFKTGQEVLVRNFERKKTEARWLGPFFVVGLHAKGVSVRRENGQTIPYNFADIKRFLQPKAFEAASIAEEELLRSGPLADAVVAAADAVVVAPDAEVAEEKSVEGEGPP